MQTFVKKFNGALTKKIKRSIRIRIMVVISVILIISSIITDSIILDFMAKEQKKQIFKQFDVQVNGISDSIEYLVESQVVELDKYTHMDSIINFVQSDVNELKNGNEQLINIQNNLCNMFKEEISHSENEFLENEFLVNKDGIIVAAADTSGLFLDLNNREYFQKIKNGELDYISGILKSNETNRYINVIVKKLTDKDGNFIGLVGKDVTSSIFSSILIKYNTGRYNVILVDRLGNVVYDKNNRIGSKTGVEALDNMKKEMKENKDVVNRIEYELDGESKIATCKLIEKLGWNIYSIGYIDDMMSPVQKALSYAQLISICVLIVALIFAYCFARKITNPIKKLTKHMSNIYKGDLTVDIDDIKTGDEIEQLSVSINATRKRLANVIGEVNNSANVADERAQNLLAITEEVSASNNEITLAMNSISQNVCDVAEQFEECRNYTEELGGAINNLESKNDFMIKKNVNVSNSLRESSEKINLLLDSKKQSSNSFNQLKGDIRGLFESINNITSFIDSIENIAEQTSLLALNAAIEAARAGEAGKGFAVVSNEIKDLSSETQEATNSIGEIIKNINSLVSKTQSALHDTENISKKEDDAFEVMKNSFDKMSEVLNEMVHISKDISTEIKLVDEKKTKAFSSVGYFSESTQNISGITEEVTASINQQQSAFESVNESAEKLQKLADNLLEQINFFRVK